MTKSRLAEGWKESDVRKFCVHTAMLMMEIACSPGCENQLAPAVSALERHDCDYLECKDGRELVVLTALYRLGLFLVLLGSGNL